MRFRKRRSVRRRRGGFRSRRGRVGRSRRRSPMSGKLRIGYRY